MTLEFRPTAVLATALLSLLLSACTPAGMATSSDPAATSDPAAASRPASTPRGQAEPVPPTPETAVALEAIKPEVQPRPERPDPVRGNWKLLMGRTTWTVRLVPRPRLAGEYSGTGTRETLDEEGKVVTMGIGAALEKGSLRAWLGPGFIVCTGLFRPAGPIEGDCTEMDGDAAGQFNAERLLRVEK